MSEYEQPGRLERAPTVEDVRQLMGASTPTSPPTCATGSRR
ncbi:MAG: hypothetical protein WKF40_01610 [Thermoleophilaceae bacterium]